MAKIYPEIIKEFTTKTEEKVYDALKSQLDDSYTVFYSRTWRTPNINQDIECDFIITAPNKGILILEVKGGQWERKGGNWYRNQVLVQSSANPEIQCRKIKSSLISLLTKTKDKFYCCDYAVIFPDCNFNEDQSCADLPFIFGYNEMSHLNQIITSTMLNMMKNAQISNPVFNNEMVAHVQKTLMRDITPKLCEKLKFSEKLLNYESKEQLHLLRSIENISMATIKGSAGAGKTYMALEKVRMLAKKREIEKILLTCYNLELADWLHAQTSVIREKCDCDGFVRFFERKAKKHGLLIGYEYGSNEYYQQVKDCMLDIINIENLSYDAIIVDEGQQFNDDYWSCIDLMLENSSIKNRYIFYDNYQKLYKETKNNIPKEDESIKLTINIRNTPSIHKFSIELSPELQDVKCNEVVGEPVEYVIYGINPTLNSQLKKILNRLIINEGVSSKDIIILTGRTGQNGDFSKLIENTSSIGKYELVKEYTADGANQIRFTTIQKFRGLEKTVVILTDIHYHDIAELSYLGGSRARAKLIWLVPDKNTDPKVQQLKSLCENFN